MNEQRFTTFSYLSDDGLRLCGRDHHAGQQHSLPIICLAGLTRNSRDFEPLANRLMDDGYRVITLDYRGRGLSERDDNKENYTIGREAQDVVAALDHLGIEKALFIGTSRGGLILHIMAATAIERIAGIVFNDIGPVIEPEGLRRIRDYLSSRTIFSDLADVAEALERIHAEEFPALDGADWLEMARALYRQDDGIWHADFDPGLIEPLKVMDFSAAMPDLWSQYALTAALPVLVVRGEHSRLLSQDTVQEMLKRHPNAGALIASGQGHAPLLHLDQVYEPLAAFLKTPT